MAQVTYKDPSSDGIPCPTTQDEISLLSASIAAHVHKSPANGLFAATETQPTPRYRYYKRGCGGAGCTGGESAARLKLNKAICSASVRAMVNCTRLTRSAI